MSECRDDDQNSRGDLLGNKLTCALLWGLPIAAMVFANFLSPLGMALVWTVSLGTMGAACLANASRCGRMHCYFTGPLFLLCAAASLTYGLGVLPLGRNGWLIIGLTALIGGGILTCVPEWIWGRYHART